MLTIDIANRQTVLPVDPRRLRRAVRAVFRRESIRDATVSVAVVDDATMRRLNREYLQHDVAADVLSFLLASGPEGMEGEILVSAETALAAAAAFGWEAENELLLYVIHGALHLAGYRDDGTRRRAAMRQREDRCLADLGLAAVPRSRRSRMSKSK